MPESLFVKEKIITCPVTGSMLTINLATRRVLLDNVAIKLTDIEFRLLWLFVNNKGTLLSHRTLLAQIWGDEFLADVNTLHVHIKHLRDKLQLRKGNITSVRGVGYRFDIYRSAG